MPSDVSCEPTNWQALVCGVMHGDEVFLTDPCGCTLPEGHSGPHRFVDPVGQVWLWETDLTCTCEHCMRCEGDCCTVYWRAEDAINTLSSTDAATASVAANQGA